MADATLHPNVKPTITSSRVGGTVVFDAAGDTLGHIEELVVDKLTGNIVFAVIAAEGYGTAERYRPIPWSLLDYELTRHGYFVPIDRDVLEAAPCYRLEDLTDTDPSWQRATVGYYALAMRRSA